jgi:tetratricopeptide (TPR) repeat protein
MVETARKDPMKLHKEGTAFYEQGKYKEAIDKFLEASQLYEKAQNIFDASYTMYKAGESSFMLKDYKTATENFLKAAELAFSKGFDRFGISAWEYVVDCYKATGEEEKAKELKKKIQEAKAKASAM